MGGGVQPSSQNPYPIYDQNLRFFLPYLLRPEQKFDALFTTVAARTLALNIIYESPLLIDGLIDSDEKVASSNKHTLKTRGQKRYS